MVEKVSEPFAGLLIELVDHAWCTCDMCRIKLGTMLTPRLERAARREAFEEWGRTIGLDLRRMETGEYSSIETADRHRGWLAAHKSVREELDR